MDGSSHVEPPARQMIAHHHLGPKHDSCSRHHEHAPDQSPVFGFLRVSEAWELGLVGSKSEIIAEILPGAAQVSECGEQVAREAAALAGESDVKDVIHAYADQDYGSNAVYQSARSLAGNQERGKPGARILQSE